MASDNKDVNDSAAQSNENSKQVALEVKSPKRILHFSDGTLEEFSDDEDQIDSSKNADNQSSINEDHKDICQADLGWASWIKLKSLKSADKALSTIDYIGEVLADILGITTPKFALEYETFKRNEEEKLQLDKENLENESWQKTNVENNVILSEIKNNSNSRF